MIDCLNPMSITHVNQSAKFKISHFFTSNGEQRAQHFSTNIEFMKIYRCAIKRNAFGWFTEANDPYYTCLSGHRMDRSENNEKVNWSTLRTPYWYDERYRLSYPFTSFIKRSISVENHLNWGNLSYCTIWPWPRWMPTYASNCVSRPYH